MAKRTETDPRKPENEMNHIEILGQSIAILRDRNDQYGDVGEVFNNACSIFEIITGEKLSRHRAAIFMHSLKLARMRKSPMKPDNYQDGINYLAFAAQFSNEIRAEQMVDEDIRDMASKLSPQPEG